MSKGTMMKGSLIKGGKKVAEKPIKQVALLSVTTAPSGTFQVGSKYYNSTDKLIYTSVTDDSWTDATTEIPEFGTVYIYDNSGTTQYYQWNGVNLIQTDVNNLVFITGTQTITGDKTFSGKADFQGETTVVTQPTSDSSQKAASTQFVKDYVQDGEWQKPSDWVDIRSGALDNSIYFLVAHSKPTESGGVYSVADFPKFAVQVGVSTNTNTYDVFVDGIKVATTASNTVTEIVWATLYNQGILKSGNDIANPGSSTYTTHIVRVAPTISTDLISLIHCSKSPSSIEEIEYQGVLWIHFSLNNVINIRNLSVGSIGMRNDLIQAITAKNDKIKFLADDTGAGLNRFSRYCANLQKIPILEASTNEKPVSGLDCFITTYTNIKIKNNGAETPLHLIRDFRGKIFECENPIAFGTSDSNNQRFVLNVFNLKKLPSFNTKIKVPYVVITRLDNIEPTQLDDSFNDQRKLLRIYGASGYQTNLVGLVVSSSAPFNYATAPQLSVKYTNMSRAALVRLFNSMPTVSDSQEIDITGAIGAGDLTAEDIAIVTGKGWTLTR